jgi:hypothetical protein
MHSLLVDAVIQVMQFILGLQNGLVEIDQLLVSWDDHNNLSVNVLVKHPLFEEVLVTVAGSSPTSGLQWLSRPYLHRR